MILIIKRLFVMLADMMSAVVASCKIACFCLVDGFAKDDFNSFASFHERIAYIVKRKCER